MEFKPSHSKGKKSKKRCNKGRKSKRTGLVNQASMNGKRKRSATMGSNGGDAYSSQSASAVNSASITPSTSCQQLKGEPSTSTNTPMDCDYDSDVSESSICSSDHDCHDDADDEQSDWPDVPPSNNSAEVTPTTSGRSKFSCPKKGLDPNKGTHQSYFRSDATKTDLSSNPFMTLGLDSHCSSHPGHGHGHNSPSVLLSSGYASKRRRRMHLSQP